MAVNAYLYIEGVEGPSNGRASCIDVLDLEWGASATPIGKHAGHEERETRADFSRLTITKVIDKTSPRLTWLLYNNSCLPAVYVVYEKPVGDMQQAFFRLWLLNAYVDSVSLTGGKEEVPKEKVSFTYEGIEEAYAPEKDDGRLDAALSCEFYLTGGSRPEGSTEPTALE